MHSIMKMKKKQQQQQIEMFQDLIFSKNILRQILSSWAINRVTFQPNICRPSLQNTIPKRVAPIFRL